ncbi:MAG TPA: Holliday junction branch migration protein RuvA, partial [Patescibacteria group bacterium]|nr:Holliday junction branch migration protein RuvA [Patescibacteria group bacterium]
SGVGYGILTTAEDYTKLNVGDITKLYIYDHIRENAHDLFGFTMLDTKSLFEQLLNVSGVGPKMALNMLSIGSGESVRLAIANGDVKFIQSANGVGRKLAERVIVELKDKVGLSGIDLDKSGLLQSDSLLLKDEAVQALMGLGYSAQDAALALADVDKKAPTTERVKLALKERK